MNKYDVEELLKRYRSRQKEHIGKTYGRLAIKDIDIQKMIEVHKEKNKWIIYFLCECECGNTKTICKASILNKYTKSCGCLSRESTIRFNKETKSKDVRVLMENGEEGKVCTKCNTPLSLDNFYSYKNGRPLSYCKKCNYTRRANIEANCSFCGKTFKTTKQQFERNEENLCSMECRNAWLSEARQGVSYITPQGRENISQLAKERLKNKENHPMYGKTYSEERKKKMSEVQMKIAKRGRDNPMYNHNISLEEREKRRSFTGYQMWRKQVYERDNYTCQLCKKPSNGDIVAHHIDGYNWCIEKRTMVDNGVTLCEDCHKTFHKKYGKGDNTREQWEDFVNDYATQRTEV